MTKLQKRKKGFTLTELAIVIAVIAILIAVLVPTFVALINNANDSVDKQTVKNLNTALSVDEADNGKPAALCGAWAVLEEYGYNPAPDPNYSENTFYWYKAENRILLVSGSTVTYPEEYKGIVIAESSASAGIALAETTTVTQLTDYSDVFYLGIDENSAYAHSGSFVNYGDECQCCHKKFSTTESFATVLGALSASNPITLVDDLTYDENSTIAGNYAYVNITSGGTLDLDGNTISISNPSPKYNRGTGIYIGATTTTLTNGTITMDNTHNTASYGVVRVYHDNNSIAGNLTLDNMTIELTGTGYGVNVGVAGKNNSTGEKFCPSATIKDSTIISDSNETNTYSLYIGAQSSVVIEGNSKIVGTVCFANCTNHNSDSNHNCLTITDGDFTKCEFYVGANSYYSVYLSGGTFSADAKAQLESSSCTLTFADGYGWSEQNSDGTYSVVAI